MEKEIQEILESIDIDRSAKRTNELRNILLTASTLSARKIIQQIDSELGNWQTVGQKSSENVPYYLLFDACAHEILQEHNQAIRRAGFAVSIFNGLNSEWNESMTHWFLGIVHRNNKQEERAEGEFKKALRILGELVERVVHDRTLKSPDRYRLRDRYKNEIVKVRRAMNGLSIYLAQAQIDNIPARVIQHDIFANTIRRLQVPDHEPHREWWNAICAMDLSDISHINLQIDILLSMLNLREEDTPVTTPFVNIFLAHCYNLDYLAGNQESIPSAIEYAENSINGFQFMLDPYNQAISYWYLALIYYNISDFQNGIRQLYEAKQLLMEQQEDHEDTDYFNELTMVKNDVNQWVENFKAQITSTQFHWESRDDKSEKNSSAPDETLIKRGYEIPWLGEKFDASKKSSGKRRPSLRAEQPQSEVGSSSRKSPPSHITIPVDMNALENFNPDSEPLNKHMFEQLKLYNKLFHRQFQSQDMATEQEPVNMRHLPISIPPLRIYCRVTAGPNGEAFLDEADVEYSGAVDGNNNVILEGRKYQVFPLRSDDNKLTIAPDHDKQYGWCKVDGESMNMSTPLPINHQDFILFVKYSISVSYDGKIVVASHPEINGQPPRLIVKRLLVIQRNLDGMGNRIEIKKSYLHSESSLEKYNEDIELTKKHRVEGEVIAVAKPV